MAGKMKLSTTHKQYPRQTLEQRVIAFDITSRGKCPSCDHELTNKEIMDGWSTDPYDFKTTCPKCKTQFIANLHWTNPETNELGSYSYICPDQLFHRLQEILHQTKRLMLGISFLFNYDREALFNMIYIFGNYRKALNAFNKSEYIIA